MKDRFNATNQKALLCRFHTQTAGSSLQAQQIDNNIIRTTLQGLASVIGGTQSLHTNSKDEALSLPTEEAAKTALRTQQIIAYESGVTDTIDPLAGSYYIEELTNEIEKRTFELIDKVDQQGGAIQAIENHFQENKIAESAYKYQQNIEDKTQIIVGTNQFTEEDNKLEHTLKIDENNSTQQLDRLKKFKDSRDKKQVEVALSNLNEKISNNVNLMEPIIQCIKSNCTLGEISKILKNNFGEYI